ncbi:multidrug effflux MFS transporter [Acetobacteraceae bacterium H6797]|nr:multidrug effflux MFS transporter [Acetobacteraceae bacterium H6797]
MQSGHRSLAIILGSLAAFAPLAIDMYLPGLPALATDLGADPARGQQTVASFFLGMCLGQAFYGSFADRLGRRPPLLFGLVVFIIGSIGCALAGNVDELIIWRLVEGLGGCAGMVIGRAIVRDRTEGEAAVRLMSMMMLAMGVAPVLAPMLGSGLLSLTGWRGIFWLLGAYGLVMLIVVIRWLPESLPLEHRRKDGLGAVFATYGGLLVNRRFLGLCLAVALPAAGMFAYIAGSAFVMMEHFSLTAGEYGLAFGLNAAGLIAMSQMNSRLLRRFSMERLLDSALVMSFAATVLLVLTAVSGAGHFVLFALGLFLFLAPLGCIMPMASTLAMAPHGRSAGSASALLGVMQFGAGAVSGAAVGLLHNGSALPMVAVMAVCALGGLLARRLIAGPAMAQV